MYVRFAGLGAASVTDPSTYEAQIAALEQQSGIPVTPYLTKTPNQCSALQQQLNPWGCGVYYTPSAAVTEGSAGVVADVASITQYGIQPYAPSAILTNPAAAAPQTADQASGNPASWTPEQAAAAGTAAQQTAETAAIQAAQDAGTYDPTGNMTPLGSALTFGENISTAISDLFGGTLSNTDIEYLLIIAAVGIGAIFVLPPLLRR